VSEENVIRRSDVRLFLETDLRLVYFIVALVSMLPSMPAPAQTMSTETKTAYRDRAHAGSVALAALYDKQKGVFRTMGWWNSANAVTTLADDARMDPQANFTDLFANTFRQAQQKSPGFLNKFYDDEGWWALAWIDAYELKGNKEYLRMAQSIFDDMAGGWDDTCGGGIWWNKDRHYKNAIANELFLSVAAKLALHTTGSKQQEYLKWAHREWTWFAASGMINDRSLINDGLTEKCINNHQPEWSYNQGVLLAGLADLSKADHDPKLLDSANRIALAATKRLTDSDGILHDPCEPDCSRNGDGVQFKGIFVRDLLRLHQESPHLEYEKFFRTNADAVWSRARTQDNHFSALWSGPPKDDGGGALGSALDALVSAASFMRVHEYYSQSFVID
jgi:predicted alpha-1,6-mannanase (GH76 family)